MSKTNALKKAIVYPQFFPTIKQILMLMIQRFCSLQQVFFPVFFCPSSDWLEVSHASTGEGEDDVAGNQTEPGGKKGGEKPQRFTGTQFTCFTSTKVQILTAEGLDFKRPKGEEEEKKREVRSFVSKKTPPSPQSVTPPLGSPGGVGERKWEFFWTNYVSTSQF